MEHIPHHRPLLHAQLPHSLPQVVIKSRLRIVGELNLAFVSN
jgi:hypothetical protein